MINLNKLITKRLSIMFGLFKKKTPLEKLQVKYKALLKESYELSTSNRKLSDAKVAEAEEVLKQIEVLKNR